MMKLSIIVVSWNTCDLLADCLESVYAHPPHGRFETIVVDNASSDGSAEMVSQRFPQARLIAKDENVGFAKGNNEAIPFCSGQYVLLLNPDTVVKPGALAALTAFMDAHPDAGAAGSRLLNPDGSLQTSCYPAPRLSREVWRLFHLDAIRPYGEYNMHKWPTDAPREVDVIKGASLIFRREVLETVGFLDGAYFMYSEEVDLCLRVQKAGWRLYWVPQSQVVHYEGQSTKQIATDMFLQLYLGKLMYFRKHYGRLSGILYKFILAAASLMRLLLTPFALLQRPASRQKNLSLAKKYGRLLAALPTM